MAWRENFREKFYGWKTKCRLKNEVLVLTMVQFILSILLDLVAIGLVFGLKLPNHTSILLAITLSLRILSSTPIIVASLWAIRKPNERCILAVWIQCCITCGIIQISTMSVTLFASVPQNSTIPVLTTIMIFFFCYILQFIVQWIYVICNAKKIYFKIYEKWATSPVENCTCDSCFSIKLK